MLNDLSSNFGNGEDGEKASAQQHERLNFFYRIEEQIFCADRICSVTCVMCR